MRHATESGGGKLVGKVRGSTSGEDEEIGAWPWSLTVWSLVAVELCLFGDDAARRDMGCFRYCDRSMLATSCTIGFVSDTKSSDDDRFTRTVSLGKSPISRYFEVSSIMSRQQLWTVLILQKRGNRIKDAGYWSKLAPTTRSFCPA